MKSRSALTQTLIELGAIIAFPILAILLCLALAGALYLRVLGELFAAMAKPVRKRLDTGDTKANA